MKQKIFQRSLPVDLTEEEIQRRGQSLADLLVHMSGLDQNFDALRKEHKRTMADKDVQKSVLVQEIRTRQQRVLVDCREVLNASGETVYVTRCDTGETIDQRPANDNDRQMFFNDLAGGDVDGPHAN